MGTAKILLALVPVLMGTPDACTSTPQPPDVVTFGDSNVAMVAGQLDGTVHAVPGYEFDNWFDEMSEVPVGDIVVVAVGSNDVLQDDTVGDVAEAAHRLARHCVVWVTPAQSSFDAMGEPFASRAAALSAEIADHEHVVVWDTQDFQLADPVHLTLDGYTDYAEVLKAAPSECGGVTTPVA